MKSIFEKIHLQIEKILHSNNIKEPPVPIKKLIEEETDYIIVESKIEDNKVSGLIDVQQKLFVLNKFESFERKRFASAHLFAHVLLHKNAVEQSDPNALYLYRKIDYLEESNQLDIEANYFAANLLVPAFGINHPTQNKEDFADLFKVHRFVLDLTEMKKVED